MKVLFVDIDGVLNVIPTERDQFGSIFHQHFIDNLAWIIKETEAKIVISSSWRADGLITMQQMWKYRNLPGEVIDITPSCYDIVNAKICEFYDEVGRGMEIQYWLDTHDNVDSFCIIDDDSDMLESQLNNFVKTSGNSDHVDCVDIGYGLTDKCTLKVVEILNK